MLNELLNVSAYSVHTILRSSLVLDIKTFYFSMRWYSLIIYWEHSYSMKSSFRWTRIFYVTHEDLCPLPYLAQ